MSEFLTLEPAIAPDRFIGREEDIEAIAAVLGGVTPQNCNLVGEPKIGRTSLLHQICERKSGAAKEKQSIYVWVALTKLPERTSVAFWTHLWEALLAKLPATTTLPSAAGPESFTTVDETERVGALFRNVHAALKAYEHDVKPERRHVVVVIDDFDLIMPDLNSGDLDRLRALIANHLEWFAFVMSSSEPLIAVMKRYDKFRSVTSQLFDVFQPLQLSLMAHNDAALLIEKAATELGVRNSDDVMEADVRFLLKEVGRHPLLLKLGCKHLFTARRRWPDGIPDQDIFYEDVRFDIRDDSLARSVCDAIFTRHLTPESAGHLCEVLTQEASERAEERGSLRRLERIGVLEQRANKLAFFADAFLGYVRSQAASQPRFGPEIPMQNAKWIYVPDRRAVIVEGTERELSSLEYRLLDYLYANANRVCTVEEIRSNVWGSAKTKSVVEKGINRLRAKVEPDPTRPHIIISYKGEGYMLRTPQQ